MRKGNSVICGVNTVRSSSTLSCETVTYVNSPPKEEEEGTATVDSARIRSEWYYYSRHHHNDDNDRSDPNKSIWILKIRWRTNDATKKMSFVLEFDGEWRPFPSVMDKDKYYLVPINKNIAPAAQAFGTTTTHDS